MNETDTGATVDIGPASSELHNADPDKVVRLIGIYNAAQSRALLDGIDMSHEDLHESNVHTLSNKELASARQNVEQFWQTDHAKELEDNFIENGQIGDIVTEAAGEDRETRLAVAEIARNGVGFVLNNEHYHRLARLCSLLKGRIKEAEPNSPSARKDQESLKLLSSELVITKGVLGAFRGQIEEFFESDFAQQNQLGRSRLRDVLAIALQGNRRLAEKVSYGVENEIAVKKALARKIAERSKQDGQVRDLQKGTAAQDAWGGDVVYKVGRKTIYVDVKTKQPSRIEPSADGYHMEPATRGHEKGYDYAFIIWRPEGESLGEHFEMPERYDQAVSAMLEEADGLSTRPGIKRAVRVPSQALLQGRRALVHRD